MTFEGLKEMLAHMSTFYSRRFSKSLTQDEIERYFDLWQKAFDKVEDVDVLGGLTLLALEDNKEVPTIPEMKRAAQRAHENRCGTSLKIGEDYEPIIIENYEGQYDGVYISGLPDFKYAGEASKEKIRQATEKRDAIRKQGKYRCPNPHGRAVIEMLKARSKLKDGEKDPHDLMWYYDNYPEDPEHPVYFEQIFTDIF